MNAIEVFVVLLIVSSSRLLWYACCFVVVVIIITVVFAVEHVILFVDEWDGCHADMTSVATTLHWFRCRTTVCLFLVMIKAFSRCHVWLGGNNICRKTLFFVACLDYVYFMMA